MSNHLCFTLDEYHTLHETCRSLSLSGSYARFQRDLAAALHSLDFALGNRIGRLRHRQVRTLRIHMERKRESQGRHSCQLIAGDSPMDCDLSLPEWQTVSRVCERIWLHDDCPHSFKGRLLSQVAEAEPLLAAKLGQLDAGQVAVLYQRVKTGKRWCA